MGDFETWIRVVHKRPSVVNGGLAVGNKKDLTRITRSLNIVCKNKIELFIKYCLYLN